MSLASARELAKRLNCRSLINGFPDNICDQCVAINAGTNLDVIEFEVDDYTDFPAILADAEDPPVSAFYRLYVVTNETPLGEDDRQQLIDALASAPYSSLGVIAQDVP